MLAERPPIVDVVEVGHHDVVVVAFRDADVGPVHEPADLRDQRWEGIEPSAITPLPGATGVSYGPVTLTANGTYSEVKQFLFALEENKRSVLVTGLELAPAEGAALVVGQRVMGYIAPRTE